MIARILSKLKHAKKLTFSASIFSLMFTGFFILYNQGDGVLDCSGNLHIDVGESPSNAAVQGNIYLIFHIVPGELSYVYESGKINFMGKEYIVNRNVRSFFHKEKHNGFYKVTREGIDKNPTDDIPDSLANELASSQKVLFLKIDNINKNLWSISDLRRTLFVCKKN